MSKVNKYVITGPSGCGKTTIVNALKEEGYYTGQEAARIILKRYPKEPPLYQQRKMVHLQHRIEGTANAREEVIFLDRGLGDMKAYSKFMGLHLPERDYEPHDYTGVFFLDPVIPYQKDDVRWEADQEQANQLADLVRKEYKEWGIPILDVPKGSVDLRVDYILRNR